MRTSILALGLLLTIAAAEGAKLKPEATEAYDGYVGSVKMAVAVGPASLDGHRERARQGEIVVHDTGKSIAVPGAIIHDWTGNAFVPGAILEDVVTLLREFDRHQDVYSEVIHSALHRVGKSEVAGRWQLLKKKFTTVVLNVDMVAEYRSVDKNRAFIASRSTRVAEVRGAGTSAEHEVGPGQGKGFLWRLNAYWWIEQGADGVFVECRTISMTGRAPAGLSWVVNPLIEEAPRESLVSTLEGTRGAFPQTSRARVRVRKGD
jgi:hypothetical protein